MQIEFADREAERENARLDRIERAWNRVLRPAGGNTGKGEAVSYLINQGVSLEGLDLSCEVDEISGTCENPQIVDQINVWRLTRYESHLSNNMIIGFRRHIHDWIVDGATIIFSV